jgi:hypothetical protein
VIGLDESAVAGTKQEFGIDQGAEKRVACGTIESPQPLRLRRRQAESGHFDVLALDTPQDVVMQLMRCAHLYMLLRVFNSVGVVFSGATDVPRPRRHYRSREHLLKFLICKHLNRTSFLPSFRFFAVAGATRVVTVTPRCNEFNQFT